MGTDGRIDVDTIAAPPDLETIPGRLAAIAAELVDVTRALTVAVAARAAPDADLALDTAGVARELGVPLKQAQKLIAARAFPVERIGKRYVRVRKGDVLAYRAAQREAARPLALSVRKPYTHGHDKPRMAAAPTPPQAHAGAARSRPRRPAGDGRALGTGGLSDPAPRRHRLHALRGEGEPLDPDEP
jgi:hypothetical protein